jgi:hypothetical protein
MMKPAIKVIALLVLVVFMAALSGCVPADCKGCRWWSYSDGYKYAQNKQIVKQNKQLVKIAAKKGERAIEVMVPQQPPPSKELSIQVTKAAAIELPEFTDQARAEMQEAIVKRFAGDGWVVKEKDQTPLHLIVSLTSYKEGDATSRIILSFFVSCIPFIGFLTGGYNFGVGKSEIDGSLSLLKEEEVILKANVGLKTATNFWSSTNIYGCTFDMLRSIFGEKIVQVLEDFAKKTPQESPQN